jgi:hypothetical protein
VAVGGYRTSRALDGSPFLDRQSSSRDPAAQVLREGCVCCSAVEVASQHFDLSRNILLIRNDCIGAIVSQRKGSSRSPGLQELALETVRRCTRLGARAPLYFYVPGAQLVEE